MTEILSGPQAIDQMTGPYAWMSVLPSRGSAPNGIIGSAILLPIALALTISVASGSLMGQEDKHPTRRIIKNDAPCYRDGPQQGRPPDEVLKLGAEVEPLTDEAGSAAFELIRMANGIECYIDRELMTPAQDRPRQ